MVMIPLNDIGFVQEGFYGAVRERQWFYQGDV